MPPLSSKNYPLLDVYNAYLAARTEPEAVQELFEAMNKLTNYPLAFGQPNRIFYMPGIAFSVETENPLIYVNQ